MVPLFLSLVLSNIIISIFPNEIQVNCTIKAGPLGNNDVLEFWVHILSLGDTIHLSK